MATLYVTISPTILDWLIKKAEITSNSSELDLLIHWRNGDKKPTFSQIEKMSKKIQVPLGYFFLEKPPVEEYPLTEFRTINSEGPETELSANLADTIDIILDIQDWMRDYVKDMGQSKKNYVASCRENMPVSVVATKIREDLELAEDWMLMQKTGQDSFRFLRQKCRDLGILIMMNGVVGANTHRPLDINEFRAFTLVDEYVPLIFINAKDSVSGRLFSLLHEIVHIWIGVNSLFNEQDGRLDNQINHKEQFCNAVASELLVPLSLFKSEWGKTLDDDMIKKVNTLSKKFTCSPVVIARRALDTHYIPEAIYHKIVAISIKMYSKRQSKEDSGGDYYRTMASRLDPQFVYAVAASAKSGRTQYTDIYRLTHTNRTTFKQLYQKMFAREGGVNS